MFSRCKKPFLGQNEAHVLDLESRGSEKDLLNKITFGRHKGYLLIIPSSVLTFGSVSVRFCSAEKYFKGQTHKHTNKISPPAILNTNILIV